MTHEEELSRLPRIRCDFKARGWSGASDDDCVYVFDQVAFDAVGAEAGKRVVIFVDDDPVETVGCIGVLEEYRGGWRIRPSAESWFRETK